MDKYIWTNIGDKFQTKQLMMKDKGQADCCPTESQNHCYKPQLTAIIISLYII